MGPNDALETPAMGIIKSATNKGFYQIKNLRMEMDQDGFVDIWLLGSENITNDDIRILQKLEEDTSDNKCCFDAYSSGGIVNF